MLGLLTNFVLQLLSENGTNLGTFFKKNPLCLFRVGVKCAVLVPVCKLELSNIFIYSNEKLTSFF